MKLRFNDTEHSYWLDRGDGMKRAKGVTSQCDIPEDPFTLTQWKRRMVAIGVASDPDIVEAVAAHADDRDKLNELCDQAADLAKANRGARRGTAVHRITETVDVGEPLIPTEFATLTAAGWAEIIAAANLEIIPDLIERVVVYPQLRMCGTFDRIVRTRKGQLVILDLKSGANALRYPRPMAIQLALYANAPLIAGPLDAHGETTVFEPMPEVDKKWGVIIHLPETGPIRADKIDIEAGWDAAQEIVFPALKWRKVQPRQLVFPLASIQPRPVWQPPEEGPEVNEADVARFRDAFKACEGRAQVDAWIKQSVDAGRSFNIAGPGCRPTRRRFDIITAAIEWSVHPEDVVRAALGLVLGVDVQPVVTIGCALGSLTVLEAIRLGQYADDLDHGRLALTFAEDGTPALSEAQPLPAA